MEGSITLPLWLFVLLLMAAVWLILAHVLLPGFRRYLRRRFIRTIEKVNTRLNIGIRPFQLTRKQALIDQLAFDDKVVTAMKEYAVENNMTKAEVHEKVLRYANEVAPSFNAYAYFRFGYWLARNLSHMLYRVRVGLFDDGELSRVDTNASIVFVMNHRSNMDYLLLSFLVAEKAALSYAVGEWARIWPLQPLIKSMGAFFVRRASRNALYRRVLERYVHLATRAGVCQAVFLEGGLTRDGLLRQPKLGFIDYMLRDYHPDIDRDVVFVPVGVNYDRVLEDVSLLRKLNPEATGRSTWFVIKTSFKFTLKTLLMSREKRWFRFGYAAVNFGNPVSISEYCQQQGIDLSTLDHDTHFAFIEKLGHRLMDEISAVVPILPVALMCEVMLANQSDWISELGAKTVAVARIADLQARGAPIKVSASACEDVLTAALTMLEGRGFIESKDGLIRAKPEALDALNYYANSIKHWQTGSSPRAES
jgi:glycerol-3-phosphate O-acyltransferase